jgi:hypothetical protein
MTYVYVGTIEDRDNNFYKTLVAATREIAYKFVAECMHKNVNNTIDTDNSDIEDQLKQIDALMQVGTLESYIDALNVYENLASLQNDGGASYGVAQYNLIGYLSNSQIPSKNVSANGCTCKQCKDHNPYAEPNQPDGSFVCRACRIYNG